MKKIGWTLALTAAVSFNAAHADVNITGAGASFPAPVYAKWADTYHKETGVKVNYQAIGSSGGIKQINAKTVDFGASDAPLSDDQLKQDGLMQFPTVIGGVVVAVNVKGIESNQLVLDGQTLGDIYLGKIKNWNDAAIAQLNPNVTLPNQDINVVRRADGSGTTFVFTSYLSKVNPEWNQQVGKSTTVKWPVGVGGKGNDGVAAFVQRLPGSIGYVEYAYAKQNNLAYTKLYSAEGQVISPSAESFSAAAKKANWAETFAQDLTNQSGDNAWPITSTTFILLQKVQDNAEKGKAVLNFFDWAYQNGQQAAVALDYAVLPENVIAEIKKAWATELTTKDGQALIE
ncbi:phosphate ABC transporter substrate-binding protein PstS [Wohlfahrtiimonas chitiniclastica]|uniref:phosphate ABC transporter substrate-binding protein PstS n=1 Tax=Wohlfahrtiimonas chitiniclastica TaxID=400946 RepID=UPI0007B697FE|nr:phosphate ABC transporter substrate-binding protein PstS [Wohlfahrtiimonas chitiniclastica]KZX36321.1 phosphate ABC transporter substrate-binding protein [Wohlfahrtiimonas chitiniclastica]MBS7820725.1 phosphate ABC transporter substrate-binding protein PstS [Wohlfahrtiimonas chitiniclastica]OYQ75040.1 phosphate ABC transporter substrate-binding protein PstS [Wohlfahrtiimonas chitiniclastica]OYQ77355.1 phosphate ABC transporter substrate-binding protein PstS [Wohlfahrtiimonas chitiniclastica]